MSDNNNINDKVHEYWQANGVIPESIYQIYQISQWAIVFSGEVLHNTAN